MIAIKVKGLHGIAPALRKLPRGSQWIVDEPWKYSVATNDGVLHYWAKPGYITDLASVPKALRGLADNGSGNYAVMISAMCHDIGYSSNDLSRAMCDQIFRQTLVRLGMSKWRAWIYYQAVNLFGGPAYDDAVERSLAWVEWDAK